jgi:hypothetical protein
MVGDFIRFYTKTKLAEGDRRQCRFPSVSFASLRKVQFL